MSLFAKLREKQKWNVATATFATSATQEGTAARSVARVATVAVASPEKLKPAPPAKDTLGDKAGASPLSAEEETLLRRWLAYTGETDPARIAATIDQCQRDANARRRSLEMAEDELEAFEERAAIMEYDGGLTRAEAERLAGRYPTAPAC